MKKLISYLFLVVLLSIFLINLLNINIVLASNPLAPVTADNPQTNQTEDEVRNALNDVKIESVNQRIAHITATIEQVKEIISRQSTTGLSYEDMDKLKAKSTETLQYLNAINADLMALAQNNASGIATQKWNQANAEKDKMNIEINKIMNAEKPLVVFDKPDFAKIATGSSTTATADQQAAATAETNRIQKKADTLVTQSSQNPTEPNECWKQCKANTKSSGGWGNLISWLSTPFQEMLCNMQCMLVGLIMEFLNFIQAILGQVPI